MYFQHIGAFQKIEVLKPVSNLSRFFKIKKIKLYFVGGLEVVVEVTVAASIKKVFLFFIFNLRKKKILKFNQKFIEASLISCSFSLSVKERSKSEF